MEQLTPVCDYEGSDYRTRFWEGAGRDYEDQVERLALRRLLPSSGMTLIEVGAGFGRLAHEYQGYEKVVLFDYSRTLLREAQDCLGNDPRFIYVAGNWYQMPFVTGLFETVVQIRTLHHAADVPALFHQLFRVARPQATYVLEFASKHNLKAMLRYAFGNQTWSPFTTDPVEFVELNYDFHPGWIRHQLRDSGFSPGKTLTVSHFRSGFLKRTMPLRLLVAIDGLVQLTGDWWQLTPSVFIKSRKWSVGETADPGHFFAGPSCQAPLDAPKDGILFWTGSGQRWQVKDGLYDLKEPLP
mgnify:FL=1